MFDTLSSHYNDDAVLAHAQLEGPKSDKAKAFALNLKLHQAKSGQKSAKSVAG